MSPIVYRMMEVLKALVEPCPVGTNLGLLHLFWAVVSGRLLSSRGAVIPALWACGFERAAVFRSWRALRHGQWSCSELTGRLQEQVREEGKWQPHAYGGYQAVACDLTAIYRPKLRNFPMRHFSTVQQRMQTAVVYGLLMRAGSVGGEQVPVPMGIVRGAPGSSDDREHMRGVLKEAAAQMGPCQALVADRGFGVALMQECGVERFVVRCTSNVVFYRTKVRPYCGHGRRPIRGEEVRPLARTYKGQYTAATPPDDTESWQEPQGEFKAMVWKELTIKSPTPNAPPFRVVAIYDPGYKQPLLLATTLPLSARQLRDFYSDRWVVEKVPQVAKQMLGAHRQFVFAHESCQRLPEIAFTAACTLMYVAATLPPCPTGPWDHKPRPTSGRLRRALAALPFPETRALPPTIRKKNSPTNHLPKGIHAHRRHPAATPPPLKANKACDVPHFTRN